MARDGGSIPPVITQSGAGYVPEVHRYRHFAIITIRYPLDYPPHGHKRMVTHPAPLLTLILKNEYMREFVDIMLKDYMKEDFSRREWIIYGVIAPLFLIIASIIVS